MRLLFLDSIEASVYGGMEEWIRLVASGLRSRRHLVTVAGRPQSVLFERISSIDREVELLPLNISGDFNPLTIAAIVRYIERNRVEVVVVNFNKDLRLGGLAAKLEGAAKVIWSAGLDITKDNLIHRFLTPKLMDGAIVPSESLKTQIIRHGYIDPELVQVIPIGIPDIDGLSRSEAQTLLRQKYQLSADSLIAVTSGRFVEQKGHRYLIEAAVLLRDRFPNLRYLWCGSGPLQAELKALARTAGFEDRILFAGMLADLQLELAGADLMIHPSIEEPFGIAVLEGMRAGLPIVASRIGGIPEVLGESYAYLVETRKPEGISEAVSSVLTNAGGAKSTGEALRNRFLEQFTLERMLDRVEAYLNSQIHVERQRG